MIPRLCFRPVMERIRVAQAQWLFFSMPAIETGAGPLLRHCLFLHGSGFRSPFAGAFVCLTQGSGIASLSQLRLCSSPAQPRVEVCRCLISSFFGPLLALIPLLLCLLDHFHSISTKDVTRHHPSKKTSPQNKPM